jgi:LuxR family transcriptional regulator, maltose regulon positive regulatory protein
VNDPLLETKLRPPALPVNRVRRARLIRLLDEGLMLGRQVSLISAPAGFGKSVLVGEWAGGLGRPIAWISLDGEDDDPARFFRYLVAAVQRIEPGFGQEIGTSWQSGEQPGPGGLSAVFANGIMRIGKNVVLVLDDFQVVQDRTILDTLERLIEHQPANLHIAIVTREDPQIPLARLRANNQLTEVRAADLQFSEPEVDQFMSGVMGLALSEGDIALLQTRTEGWAAGLQLSGLALRSSPDPARSIATLSGTQRFILGYLTEEVLDRLDPDLQQFLVDTSILDRLSAELCDAVTGRSDSQTVLNQLYAANLFLIPLDDEQRWYRYHHLFADLLRSQLSRIPKSRVLVMRAGASRGYEQAGMTAEAIRQALAAEDYPRGAQLLEDNALGMLVQGYAKTVESWVEAIPERWRSHSPRAVLALAWIHLLRGNYNRVAEYLERAEIAIPAGEAEKSPRTDLSRLRAELLGIQSNLYNVRGDPQASIESARQALVLAGSDNAFVQSLAFLGLGGAYRLLENYPRLVEAYQQAIQTSREADNRLAEMMAVTALSQMAIQHGQLRFAAQVTHEALERIEASTTTPPPISGIAFAALALVEYEWNRLERAHQELERGMVLVALSGHNAGVVYARVLTARLAQARGDLARAAALMNEAAGLATAGVPAWLIPEVPAQQVRILLAQGNPTAAEAVLAQNGYSDPGMIDGLLEPVQIAWLRVWLYRAREGSLLVQPGDAERFVSQLIDAAQAAGRLGSQITGLLLRAQLRNIAGKDGDAQADLRTALGLGKSEGYIRTFVDEGEPLQRMLLALRSSSGQGSPGDSGAYLDELLAAFPGGVIHNRPGGSAGLPEPLTDREIEVLRLIAEGLKYEEIAERLVISVNTVRFYVKEIYGKLGVNNRMRAVEMARREGLL